MISWMYMLPFSKERSTPIHAFSANEIWTVNNSEVFNDDVYLGDAIVGISSGRIYSYYSRKMISLCLVDVEYTKIRTPLKVIWGNPRTNQKSINVIVSKFPYLDLPRNKDIDINQSPDRYKEITIL